MLYSLIGKMRRPFTGSDLLYRGALEGMFDSFYIVYGYIVTILTRYDIYFQATSMILT
jgi:hypothetical protein